MTEEKVNRFTKASQTWHGNIMLIGAAILITLCIMEIFSYGAALLYFKLTDKNIEVANNQFLIGRLFANNPIPENTGVRYLGHLGGFMSIQGWHVADPLLGWRLGKSVGITSHYLHAKDVAWQATSQQGFAISDPLLPYINPEKPKGTFRVFVLGGSTVEGMGAKTPYGSLPAQFSQLVNKTARPKGNYSSFEVINAGVAGYNSAQEFLYLSNKIISYNPDLVIFYNGWNDQSFWNYELRLNPNHQFPKYHSNSKRMAIRLHESYTFLGSLKHAFQYFQNVAWEYSSQIALLWIPKGIYNKTISKNSLLSSGESAEQLPDPENDPNILKGVAFYEKNLNDSINFSISRNIKVANFLQPIVGLEKKRYYELAQERIDENPIKLQLSKNFYKIARKMFKKLKHTHKDQPNACIADISDSMKNEEERLYADTGGHLNRKGNAIIAKTIRDHLIQCGILELRTS